MVSVLNFFCSMTSLSLLKYRIRRTSQSDFSQKNVDEINFLDSCFVLKITDLANKVLISAVINSCLFLLNGYWFTAGRLSLILKCIPDTIFWMFGSCDDLTLSWGYFLTRSLFLLAMHLGKKSVFLWFPAGASVVGVLCCTVVLIVVAAVVVAALRLIWPSYIMPLLMCPLLGLGRYFEVWWPLWKEVFPFPQ